MVNVLLPAKVMVLPGDRAPVVPAAPSCRVPPAVTVVGPVYVLVPDRIVVPVPAKVIPPETFAAVFTTAEPAAAAVSGPPPANVSIGAEVYPTPGLVIVMPDTMYV